MRKILSGILLLIALPGFCQTSFPKAESGMIECIYRLTYRPDSTNQNSRSEEMSLLIGKKVSKFRSKIALVQDSLVSVTDNRPLTQESGQALLKSLNKLPPSNFKYTIYKMPSTKQVLFYSKLGNKEYSYSEPSNLFAWQITPIVTKIAGHTCQKAVTLFAGRMFEAWFTREIPIAEGPYKFYGLPGLIIKISDSRDYYSFELTKINNLKAPGIISAPIMNVISTTKKAFHQGEIIYEAGTLDRLAAMGNTFDDATKQAVRERAKKKNNPLELK